MAPGGGARQCAPRWLVVSAKNRPVRLSVAATRLREHKLRRDMFDVIDEALVAGAQPSSYSQVPLGFSGVASVTQLRDAS